MLSHPNGQVIGNWMPGKLLSAWYVAIDEWRRSTELFWRQQGQSPGASRWLLRNPSRTLNARLPLIQKLLGPIVDQRYAVRLFSDGSCWGWILPVWGYGGVCHMAALSSGESVAIS